VSIEEFYDCNLFALMPMGSCYPGKGTSGDLASRPECAPLWHQPLLSQMKQVKLVILIGQYAQKYYLGGELKLIQNIYRCFILRQEIKSGGK
jgi:uracil-DNA glycosylase